MLAGAKVIDGRPGRLANIAVTCCRTVASVRTLDTDALTALHWFLLKLAQRLAPERPGAVVYHGATTANWVQTIRARTIVLVADFVRRKIVGGPVLILTHRDLVARTYFPPLVAGA